MADGLTDAQRDAFARDGYVVLTDVLTARDCDDMIARATALVRDADPAELASVFTTREQERASDDYFLDSGDKVRFFLEEEAVGADGALRVPKSRAINKIGHALHELDPVFRRISHGGAVRALIDSLGMAEPVLIQSMYIFKQPHIGGEVRWHQDSTFLYTDPPSTVGLWFAVEDATVDNGCLWALPGAHRDGVRSRFIRTADDAVETRVVDARPWPESAGVPLEVPRGAVILLHGALPHRSEANRSERSRHAYTLHVIDGSCRYPEDNWLRPGGRAAEPAFE